LEIFQDIPFLKKLFECVEATVLHITHAGGGRLGGCGGSLAHRVVSGSSRAAGAALPLCAAMVATKTPATIAMAGALPTINNQLKVAVAMATEMVTSTTIENVSNCGSGGS
jgi:hypothetical protein